MYTIPGLVGKYGLYDAYNYKTKAQGNQPWIAKSYLGIDKGLVLLMFENYSSHLIWRLLHQNICVQKGLKTLEFAQLRRFEIIFTIFLAKKLSCVVIQ